MGQESVTFRARGLYASSNKEPGTGFHRGPWLVLGGVLAVVLVAVAAVSVLGSVSMDRGERRDTFAAPEQVVVENRTGGRVSVTAADGDEVRVDRGLRGTPLADPGEDIEAGGGRLRIDAACSGAVFSTGCSIDYTIAVPAGVAVRVETVGGRVAADGVQGPVRVSTASGPVELTGITGEVRVETVSGRVAVTGVVGDVDLETVHGSITASGEGGRLRAASTSGRVDLAGFTAGSVEAESTSGRISVGGGFDTAEVSTTSGGVEVDASAPFRTLVVETTSGSVDARVPEGAYDVTGESVSGERTIAVGAAPSGPRIQVDTVSGDVRVSGG